MGAGRPSISVILSTMGTLATLEQTISRLLDQTICGEMELVLVSPPQNEPWWIGPLRDRFHSIQSVVIPSFVSIAASYADGVRAASSEIVALGEDHCFPEPEWAVALVAAHQGDWAAVGPQVSNANPDSAVSRADFLIGYSPWSEPCPAGERAILPGHNSSYKRSVLIEYGDSLADWLQAETVLHYELASKGHRLYLEPRARTAHVNFSRLSSWVGVQLMQGRVFASERRRDWGLGRRLFFAAASPLIPLVRLAKITREYFVAPRSARAFLVTLPHLFLGLVLDGVGQGVGYALGAGDTLGRISELELQRVDHITDADRMALFGPEPLRAKLGVPRP